MSAAPRPPTALLGVAFALLGVALLPSCYVGAKIDELAPAQTGQGIEVRITPKAGAATRFGMFSAELLAVRADALLVRVPLLEADPLVLVSYEAIGTAEVTGLDRLSFGGGRAPSEEMREELRLLSRYPQGVSDDLLRRLLQAYDQDELDTIP